MFAEGTIRLFAGAEKIVRYKRCHFLPFSKLARRCRVASYAAFRIGPAGEICFSMSLVGHCINLNFLNSERKWLYHVRLTR
jgi:hypothetical protein